MKKYTRIYRKCPWCNKEFKNYFNKHILKHGKSIIEYIFIKYNINDLPKCPYCNNKCSIKNNYTINKTCGNKDCKHKSIINTQIKKGTLHLLKKNLVRDNRGKSIIHSNNQIRKSLDGSHNLLSKNRKLDINGKDIIAQKINNTRNKNESHVFLSKNHPRDINGKSIYRIKSNRTKILNNTHNFLWINQPKTEDNKSIYQQNRLENKTHNLLSSNRVKNDKDKDIYMIKNNKTRLKNKSHHFLSYNRLKDNNGKDLLAQKAYKSSIKNGTHISLQKVSKLEKTFYPFLDTLSIEYNTSNRKVIYPYELDIYIPSKSLAIELNGLYWHKYDNLIEKSNLCYSKDIFLIHFMDNEWIYKKSICKSIIKYNLNLNNIIDIKECTINKINEFPLDFIKDNYLEYIDYKNNTINYGIYYKDELIYTMIFERVSDNNYKLILCNKKDYDINSIDSIIEKFIDEYNPSNIEYHLNRRYENHKLFNSKYLIESRGLLPLIQYINLNNSDFKSEDYYKNNYINSYDKNISLHDNMIKNSYSYFYDSGYIVYKYTRI